LPKSEKYNDGENDVRSKLDLVKELNEILSIENAAAVRIASRIDRTPIQEVKRILKRNLIETNTQKIRLQDIIKQFGEEPTSMKADLSFVSTNNITTRSKNNHPENTKIGLQNMSLKHSLPEEYEMEQIRQDFAINHDELVAYESLIGKIQKMNIPHQQENISLLEKSMKEVESMVYWYKIHTPLIIDNLWPKVIHTSIKRGQNYLLNHIGIKIPLVIMYADLVGSTKMSMTLPTDNLVSLIRAFDHQISHVVDSQGGYVLKYAGDGVISFFPGRVNNQDRYLTSSTSVGCGKLMINAIKDEINSILHYVYQYPELFVKIGIDAGENAVVQFGYEHRSPIDILGYSMNIASKITSITGPNKVSIGENVYKSLDSELQSEFHELSIPDDRWKYVNYGTDRPYKIYTLNT
jgi:class 3 adenylate cyclase